MSFLKTRILFSFVLVFIHFFAQAQTPDTTNETQLPEIIIKAFEQNRRLREIPAAVNYLGRQNLERFNPSSVVMAVNTTPGVRMEERSPGSYRLNIRGSSLRSPFGVRNVKIYYNDIPVTDPGGNTYLNQLGYYNMSSIEIIKGPGSSLYGAGTGGVMLIESLVEREKTSLTAQYTAGSYGVQNIFGAVTSGSEKSINRIGFQHQQGDGYRVHSALQRDVLSWNGWFRFDEKRQLKTTFLYSKLFYETPGALTLGEYNADPRAARPGAAASNASITQRTFIAGASYAQQLSADWQNKTVAYGMFTELRNPTLRNYGKSSEPHAGVRSVFKFEHLFGNTRFNWDLGGEAQHGFTTVNIHKNISGSPGALDSLDEINNRQYSLFTQATIDLGNWNFNVGASWNHLLVKLQHFNPATRGVQDKNFDNEIAPRFSVSRKLKSGTVYSSISKGFSPPTTAELTPSGSPINLSLSAEEGINYDLGWKNSFANGLYIDVNAFVFSLNNTIVTRRDAAGGDYFINAGKTEQHGIETYIGYTLLPLNGLMKRSLFWISHAWHDFHYKEFEQVNPAATPANQLPKTLMYSGNEMPATAPHTISAGVDFIFKNGISGNASYYFSDEIPLNDANTEYASAYHLLSFKLGYERWLGKKLKVRVLGAVENLMDQQYSLGNDINGFGGRYYNAAPGRNYYASIALQWNDQGQQ